MIFDKKINISNVLVCVGKDLDYDTFSMPYIEDLSIYFVREMKTAYKIINKKDFKKLKITEHELFNKAIENTKNKIYSIYKEIPLSKNEECEVAIPYDADVIIEKGKYNFWTSLVLMPEFWNNQSDLCIEKNWRNYYIAMPYRTFLIIGNANSVKAKDEIIRLVKDYEKENKDELLNNGDFEAAKRAISNNLYIMENGNLKFKEII